MCVTVYAAGQFISSYTVQAAYRTSIGSNFGRRLTAAAGVNAPASPTTSNAAAAYAGALASSTASASFAGGLSQVAVGGNSAYAATGSSGAGNANTESVITYLAATCSDGTQLTPVVVNTTNSTYFTWSGMTPLTTITPQNAQTVFQGFIFQ